MRDDLLHGFEGRDLATVLSAERPEEIPVGVWHGLRLSIAAAVLRQSGGPENVAAAIEHAGVFVREQHRPITKAELQERLRARGLPTSFFERRTLGEMSTHELEEHLWVRGYELVSRGNR